MRAHIRGMLCRA